MSSLGVEDHAEAGADERLVVGDQDADAHARSREREPARTAKPPPAAAAGVELAAEERDALAHPDQAVAAAVERRAGAWAVVGDLELERRRRRSGRARRRGAAPACLSVFVSASWTIR